MNTTRLDLRCWLTPPGFSCVALLVAALLPAGTTCLCRRAARCLGLRTPQ